MVRALRIDAIAITYCILHHVPITSLSWNSSPPSSCTLSSRGVSIIPSASSSHQRYFCLHEMPSNHRRSVMTAFIPGHDRCFKRRIPGQSGQQNCYGFGAIGPSAVLNVNQYNNRGSSNWVSQHQHLLLHHTSSSTLFSSANDSFESSPESKTKTTKTRSQQSKKTSAENTNNKKSTPKKKKTPTKKKTSAKPQTPPSYATMSTAVCIVPPDDAWDTIQRARHLARDTCKYSTIFLKDKVVMYPLQN